MASYGTPNNIINRVAASDLSASTKLYLAIKATTDTAGDVAGAGEVVIGFLNNLPTSGAPMELNSIGGGSNALSNDTITVGLELASDANGKMVTAVATDWVCAIALQEAVAGDIFEVLPVGYIKP